MVLEKCCFCCKLETGGTILGFMATVLSFLWLVLGSLGLSSTPSRLEYQIPFGIFLTFAVISFMAAIVLIIGIAKRERNCLIPWMIIMFICLIPLIPFAFATIIAAFPFVYPFYLWYCIYSLFHTFPLTGENRPHILSNEEVIIPYRMEEQTDHDHHHGIHKI